MTFLAPLNSSTELTAKLQMEIQKRFLLEIEKHQSNLGQEDIDVAIKILSQKCLKEVLQNESENSLLEKLNTPTFLKDHQIVREHEMLLSGFMEMHFPFAKVDQKIVEPLLIDHNLTPDESDALSVQIMQTLSFQDWPEKAKWLLNSLSEDKRGFFLAKGLVDATCDELTREIGIQFLKILENNNGKNRYIPLNRLYEMFPLNEQEKSEIWTQFFTGSLPFMNWENRSICRTNFYVIDISSKNDFNKVLMSDQLMIGFHHSNRFNNKNLKQESVISLIAFDINNGKIVWDLTVDKNLSNWHLGSMGLILGFENEGTLRIYNPKTGDLKHTIKCPFYSKNGRFYITPSGFCYYVTDNFQVKIKCDVTSSGSCHYQTFENKKQRLIGGKISTGKWKTIFQHEIPPNSDLLKRAHFIRNSDKIIASPDGSLTKLPETSDFFVVGSQAIIFNLCSNSKKDLIINVYSLENPAIFKLGEKQKEFHIPNGRKWGFRPCGDGVFIAVSKKHYYFIDIENQKISNLSPRNAQQDRFYIDVRKKAFWIWNEKDKILWKHSREGSKEMGKVDGGWHFKILHVDEEDRVFVSKA